MRKGYTDLPEEYLLLTALLGTDGTTPGITQGANTTEAQYVAKQLAGETGRRQFITKEQVEYAARELFGEEVELTHQSVPVAPIPGNSTAIMRNTASMPIPKNSPSGICRCCSTSGT